MDWVAFTPLRSLIGGILIGLSAVFYFASQGRIAGISGITAQAFHPRDSGVSARGFLVGLLGAGFVLRWLVPSAFGAAVMTTIPTAVIAGVLVGVGTRWSRGCTSGHGVCGLSQGSFRSLMAVMTFMATGMMTVLVLRVAGVRS